MQKSSGRVLGLSLGLSGISVASAPGTEVHRAGRQERIPPELFAKPGVRRGLGSPISLTGGSTSVSHRDGHSRESLVFLLRNSPRSLGRRCLGKSWHISAARGRVVVEQLGASRINTVQTTCTPSYNPRYNCHNGCPVRGVAPLRRLPGLLRPHRRRYGKDQTHAKRRKARQTLHRSMGQTDDGS